MKFIKLAWRNVWRNRRRSFITMAAIIFAVVITAVMRSLQYGTYDAMEAYAVRLLEGELQVQKAGFQEEKTLTYSFKEDARDWQKLFSWDAAIQAHSKRITSFGLVSSDSGSAGAMIVGVQPQAEGRVTRFISLVVQGDTLQPGDDHRVLLGRTLARNLQVQVGDTVVVLTQGFHNELGADSYVVKGTLKSGNLDLDRALLVMSLVDAQDLFSMYGRVTQVVVRTDNFRKAKGYARQISQAIGDSSFTVLPWQQLMPELLQLIAWDNVSGAIFLAFLLLIVGFEILNTTLMSIMERTKEFGILQSIGVKPRQLSLLIFLESVIKISLALAIGFLLSYALLYAVKGYPIPLSGELKETMESWGFISNFYFTTKSRVFLEPLITIAIISAVAIIYPLRMVTKLSPIEALRKV